MLQLRSQMLGGQWEKTLNEVYEMRLKNCERFWQWNTPDLTATKMNADNKNSNPPDFQAMIFKQNK
jgi:hypothetical protein